MKRAVILTFVLLALVGANLLCGPTSWHADGETLSFVVTQIRLPQTLTALLAGMALAVSGLVMQTVFGNPLADPSILGVTSGAGLGVAIALLACGSLFMTLAAAFCGALIVIFLLVAFSLRVRGKLTLLVTGIMLSFIISSFVSLLSVFATAEGVHSYVIWGLGDFSGVTLDQLPVFAPITLAAVVCLALMSKSLNTFLLGENYATSIGINVRFHRAFLLLFSGILTALVTAFCGPISFIGLAAPHIARLLFKTADHRKLIPATLLTGAGIALLCQLASHSFTSYNLPVNALTPLFGAPVVIYLLVKRR